MSNDHDLRVCSARIRQAGNSGLNGLHDDFAVCIKASIANLFEELENTDDSHAMTRLQGGVRALRQLLTDITPRSGE